VVFDQRREFLAIGLYDPTSHIRVRVLHSGSPTTIDEEWLTSRLSESAARRTALADGGTTGYRVVHGESDGLPGLVVDRYGATVVCKIYTVAWVPWLPRLRRAILAAVGPERVVLRLSREVAARRDHLGGLLDGQTLAGDAPRRPVQFVENGLRFEADVVRGHKTGFFLDQRENRAKVGRIAAGRRVLDVFAYSGAFSLYAAAGGATDVLSIDSSSPALDGARRNFALNNALPAVAAARHVVKAADGFDALAQLGHGSRFDLIVVDPPAMAKRHAEVPGALRAYARLTQLALCALAPGGTLVLTSCSSRIGGRDFYGTILRSATTFGRRLVELDRTGHPEDHPIGFPEAEYLHCLFARAP
jgi:23S rRNA (cytosine1962-C5)-methyltransferase